MSNTSRSRISIAQSLWSGPTSDDLMNASGRANIIIRFISTSRGPRRELLVRVGPAYRGHDLSVVFEGRTVLEKLAVKGYLDATKLPFALATIECFNPR